MVIKSRVMGKELRVLAHHHLIHTHRSKAWLLTGMTLKHLMTIDQDVKS